MKQGPGQITRQVALVFGVMLAGVFIAWLVVLRLGISIPLDSFRHPIETAASRALGRQVHIDGVLLVRPTMGPTIVAHDVRIASPAGRGDLLRAGRVAVRLTPSRPWPLRAAVSFKDTWLLLNGNLEVPRQDLTMTFELQVDRPAQLARIAERLGQASLAGQLWLHADQGRPLVAGELQLPALDAVLRFGAGAGPPRDSSDQPGPGGETLADRPVSVPLTVSIADVPFHGQLVVDGQDAEPALELALSATDANAGKLFTTLTGPTAIRGRFPHIGLQASVRGSGESGFLNRVALALQVDGAKLSYHNAAGERPVDVTLDKLALTLPAGEAVMMQARGALLDESFSAEFTTAGLEALLAEDSWPIRLSATGGGAVLDISGPLAAVHADAVTRLHVGLYGTCLGDLAAWLGVSPCAATFYTLRGQLVLAEDVGRLQFLQLQTGRTRLNGELDWSGYDQIDLLHAVLHFEELDPADIEVLIPLVSQGSDEGAAGDIAIDIPVLPRRVAINNADIELTIEHILLKLVDITEVSLSARIRGARLLRSPFHTHIGNASFQGYLDPATAETAVVFENEDYDSAAGGRMDKLFSSAVRWVGSTAGWPYLGRNPKGRGHFSAGLRCRSLMYGRYTALTAPCPAKKWPPSLAFP